MKRKVKIFFWFIWSIPILCIAYTFLLTSVLFAYIAMFFVKEHPVDRLERMLDRWF